MPLIKPKNKEKKSEFVSRCIGDNQTGKDFPDQKQRIAVCYSQWDKAKKEAAASVELNNDEFLVFSKSDCFECDETVEAAEEVLTLQNLHIPTVDEYLSAEEIEIDQSEFTELNVDEYFNIEVANAAEYQGRKVTLNKPFRTPDGPKKSAVYVKNQSGKVVIVRFGDKNMSIKKNIPARRKSFRARHNCDNPGPVWKARYWACKSW
jgi:hypothetical protein